MLLLCSIALALGFGALCWMFRSRGDALPFLVLGGLLAVAGVFGVLVSLREFTGEVVITEQYLVERDSLVYNRNEFYSDGKKKSSGRLIGTRRTGTHEQWHANGKKKMSGFFRNDLYIGAVDIWNEKGIRVFHSVAWNSRDTMKEEIWSETGARLAYGTLLYEQQRAKWIPDDLAPYYTEVMNVGQVIVAFSSGDGIFKDHYGVSVGPWHEVGNNFSAPEFPGFQKGMTDYVYSVARYPAYEAEERIEGETVITFTVNADGTVSGCLVERSSSPGLDQASLEIVRKMPPWIPGTRFGKPREFRCWIEIEWRISD